MLKSKRPKHLHSLTRLDNAYKQAIAKYHSRFETMPSSAVMATIKQKIRKEHRLAPYMGRLFQRNQRETRIYDTCKYHHWIAGKNNRGHTVRFCWSHYRNEAGYFLFWQEIVRPKRNMLISTSRWGARQGKPQAKEISRKRMLKWRERHAKTT